MSAPRTLLALALVGMLAAPGAGKPFATVTRVQQRLNLRLASQLAWMDGKLGALLGHGDAVRTHQGSRAEITYQDGTVARLGPNAMLVLDQLRHRKRFGWGRFLAGRVWLKIARGERAEIVTPAAVASVLGTEFVLDVAESHATKIIVLDGAVDFTGSLGDTVRVPGGYWGEAVPGQKVQPPQAIDAAAERFARGVGAPVD